MQLKQTNAHRILFLLVSVALLFLYAPSFLVSYAKLDTIAIHAEVQFGVYRTWTNWISIQGRILASLFVQLFYSGADDIADLRWIRLVGFFGTLATAYSLLHILEKQGLGVFSRVIACLWICTLPAIATFTVWATCFTYSWAVAIALTGGWICISGEDSKVYSHKRLVGSSLIFISLWFYQPSALFALIPLFLHVIQLRTDWQDVLKRGLTACFWVIVPLPLYFVSYKGIFLKFMPDLESLFTGRLNPSGHLAKQLGAVLETAVPEALSGWLYFFGPLFENGIRILLVIILIVGISASCRGNKVTVYLLKCCLLAGIVLVSLIPVLYLSTAVPWPRMMGSFSGIAVLGVVLSLRKIFAGRFDTSGKALLISLLLLQFAAASYAINKYWIQQAKSEIEAYEEVVAALDSRPGCLVLIDSNEWIRDRKKRHYAYGFVSTTQIWVMEPLMRLLLAEKFGMDYAKSVHMFSSTEAIDAPFTVIVDANEILFDNPVDVGSGTEQLNGFDSLYVLKLENSWTAPSWWASPWYASSWFGIFRDDPDDPTTVLHHSTLGRIEYGWDWELGILHLNLPDIGWSTTTPQTFPLMKHSADGYQFWLDVSDAGENRFSYRDF